MITIQAGKVERDGQTVGYLEGNYVRDHGYNKIGYYDEQYVRDQSGNKLSYIEGEYLYSYESRSSRTMLDQVNKAITGDAIPELAKCAIYQLLGA